jgi:hypothetical protein
LSRWRLSPPAASYSRWRKIGFSVDATQGMSDVYEIARGKLLHQAYLVLREVTLTAASGSCRRFTRP